ncbi:MAG: hypothetical protein ABI430_01180 [Candidatus Taylorbacteria bacterium]
MPLEGYTHFKDMGQFDRPEDELETPVNIEIKKRERAFSAEQGFQELLKLKIIIRDLHSEDGPLRTSNTADWPVDLIRDPKMYAYSSLGFDSSSQKEILPEELNTALQQKLKEIKIESTKTMDKYLETITIFENVHQSKTLNYVKYLLEACKESLTQDDWESYGHSATQAQATLRGVEGLVNLCCGSGAETDETRKALRLEKAK